MTQPAIIRVRARLMMPTSKPSKWKICHDRGTITEYRQAMVITSIRCCLAIGPQNSSGEPAIFFRGANVSSEDCQNRCDITKRNVSAPGVPCADEHRRIPNDRESRCKVPLLSKHELTRVRPSRPSCLPLAAVARQVRRGARRLSCIQRKSGQAPGPPRYTRTFRQSKLHSATHFVKAATPCRPVPICDFVSQWPTINLFRR
jgi:hypothetical protein